MKARIPLFLFLIGLLFVFIGLSDRESPRVKSVQTKEVQSSQTQISPTPAEQNQVLITKVIDGDTVDVQIGNQKNVVRLIGINAPETNQCFGKEATDKAVQILSSKTVSLESDPTQGDRDKYRRLLRYVFINNVNFDELMVKEGFAKEYTYDKPYKYQSEFKNAQTDAQTNKRGLWADNACSNFSSPTPKPKVQATPPPQNSDVTYNCDCSKLCSQISTCQEAYYQLQTCGCSARDLDHDGIPCESLCK